MKRSIQVRAIKMRVTTGEGDDAHRETLLVARRPSSGRHWYYLSNSKGSSFEKMAKTAACRHYVKQAVQFAKGEVGLAEYEVRSRVGWR